MRWLKRNENSRLLGYPPVNKDENALFLHDWTEKTTTFAGGVILRIAKPQWNRQFVLELPQWLFLGGDMLPHLSFTKRTWEKKCRRASPMWHMWISKKTWVSYGFLYYLYSVSLKSAASTNLLQAALKRFFERAGNVRRRGRLGGLGGWRWRELPLLGLMGIAPWSKILIVVNSG